MDHKEFDDLSRALVTPGTRRGAVGLAAGLLGLGVISAAEAGGESKQKRRRQRRKKQDRRNGLSDERCSTQLKRVGCFFGRVGLADAWTCPPDAYLASADLTGCNFNGAIMREVILNSADLRGVQMNNADFTKAKMHWAKLDGSTMVQAKFIGAYLGGVEANRGDMRETDFGGGSLNSAKLVQTPLTGAIMQNTDLRGVQWAAGPIVPDLKPPFVQQWNLTNCPDGSRFLWPNDCCGHLNGWTTPWC